MEEIWKDIDGYEGIYQVSSHGKIKSLDKIINGGGARQYIRKGRIRKPVSTEKGYLRVLLTNNGKRKGYFVHRLVALAFLAKDHSRKHVNHINHIKSDNLVSNLEWVTPAENNQKSIDFYNRSLKYDEFKVLSIITFFKTGLNISKIANIFNAPYTSIKNIVEGRRRTHITKHLL